MEPTWSTEFLLRTYEAFLLYLAVLLAAFAGVAFLSYLAFLCEACLPLRRFSRPVVREISKSISAVPLPGRQAA